MIRKFCLLTWFHCCRFNTKNKSQIYFSLMASSTRTRTKRNVAFQMPCSFSRPIVVPLVLFAPVLPNETELSVTTKGVERKKFKILYNIITKHILLSNITQTIVSWKLCTNSTKNFVQSHPAQKLNHWCICIQHI